MDNPKECIKCKENKLLENNNQANLLICSNCPTGYKCDGTQVPVECEERSKGEDGDNNGILFILGLVLLATIYYLQLMKKRNIEQIEIEIEERRNGSRNYKDSLCIICYQEVYGMRNRTLPCSHTFHPSCIRTLLTNNRTCPT